MGSVENTGTTAVPSRISAHEMMEDRHLNSMTTDAEKVEHLRPVFSSIKRSQAMLNGELDKRRQIANL